MELITLVTVAVSVGAAAGYLGAFMVLRRMALVGDALSHVALPGVALGLVFGFNPLLGAFAALFGGIMVVWLLEGRTKLPTEALIGLLFTVSLAVGLLITPDEELLEALFGDIANITLFDGVLAVVLSIAVVVIMKRLKRDFMVTNISDELARSTGVKTTKINFIYLILVAVVVALGIKAVGILLMGALVVIPAIASKNLSGGLSNYIKLSTLFGALSGAVGILLSSKYALAPGPVIVLVSAGVFAVTLMFKRDL